MLRYLVIVLLAASIASCNNERENETTTTTDSNSAKTGKDADEHEQKPPAISGCYLRVIGKDSLAASLTQEGNIIKGKLTFDNYEKDGSNGTVSGSIDKDIIKLVYRFQSEGMNSVSEVYFKITGDGLLHGIGEVAVKGDSAYYSDPAGISYPAKEKLEKVSCDALPAKFRQ